MSPDSVARGSRDWTPRAPGKCARRRCRGGRPDQPIVYFYCHGHKERHNSPNTWLGVGKKEFITAGDFTDWVTAALPVKIWDKVRPLVVINACHSLDVLPETFLSYVDAFVGSGTAVGVIGTEVKIPQAMAMRWAEAFFEALARDNGRADQALRAATLEFLAAGNLFGLVYTAHCWAHLSLVGGKDHRDPTSAHARPDHPQAG